MEEIVEVFQGVPDPQDEMGGLLLSQYEAQIVFAIRCD